MQAAHKGKMMTISEHEDITRQSWSIEGVTVNGKAGGSKEAGMRLSTKQKTLFKDRFLALIVFKSPPCCTIGYYR